MGQYLRSNHPESLHARVLFNSEVLWPIWGELLETVRSGKSGAVQTFGMPFYDYLQLRPEMLRRAGVKLLAVARAQRGFRINAQGHLWIDSVVSAQRSAFDVDFQRRVRHTLANGNSHGKRRDGWAHAL